MSCVIRDMSEGGARLKAPFTPDLPKDFTLLIPSEATMVAVRRAWWSGDQMGIKFMGEFTPAPKK
jgi:two-component system cell cycle response regulator